MKKISFLFLMSLFVNIFATDVKIDLSVPLPSDINTPNASNTSGSAYSNQIMQNEYERFVLDHYKATYWTQYFLSVVIFLVVVFLVLLGAWLSYKQFTKPYIQSDAVTEMKAMGMEIKTSVIGFIILFISLAFFYLYILYVFPIKHTI